MMKKWELQKRLALAAQELEDDVDEEFRIDPL
jgi:hypothetical protein